MTLTSMQQRSSFLVPLHRDFPDSFPQHGIRVYGSREIRPLESVELAILHSDDTGDSLGVGHDQGYLTEMRSVLQVNDLLAGRRVNRHSSGGYEVHTISRGVGLANEIVGEKNLCL